jgi:hypothetical protein
VTFLRKRTWYVEPRGRRWSVRREDARAADSLHDRKEDAIARAIELGRRAEGRCRVKGLDGRIEHEHVFTESCERS